MEKPPRTFWQIWNMSFGFLGIQFGWGLQMANMSAIYEYLGARADQIPILWLAAPLTGLIVQPIIGHASDRTWGPLGRRRPYFLAGAILSSMALILMPRSSALWMAAGLLWVLDACINISMEPFRAFVADLLPEFQRTRGFAMQSLFIGLGAVVASALPYLLTNVFHVTGTRAAGTIPVHRASFFLHWRGGIPGRRALDHFHDEGISARQSGGISERKRPNARASAQARAKSWRPSAKCRARCGNSPGSRSAPGWGCSACGFIFRWRWRAMCLAPPTRILLSIPREWSGRAFVSERTRWCVSDFHSLLPALARRFGRKATHSLCLICGGLGLLSVAVIHNKYLLLFSMAGVGIAWASTLSMPYSILAGSLPQGKTGVYMGIFNFFIVIPEITASLGFGWVMGHLLNNNRIAAVVAGGIFFMLAAVLTQRVDDLYDLRQPSSSLPGNAVAAKS